MEQRKLTISAIIIATYTTLIFTIPKVVPQNNSAISAIIYSAFVVFGLVIDLIFFLYISFSALEASSVKELPIFDLQINQTQAQKIKNRLFNFGTYLIFLSITMAVWGEGVSLLIKHLNWWVALSSGVVFFILADIIFRLIIKQLAK